MKEPRIENITAMALHKWFCLATILVFLTQLKIVLDLVFIWQAEKHQEVCFISVNL